jgi:Domain of unknown function (DUF4136)
MALRMALLGLVGLLAGCSTVRTQHDYDPQAPFPTYKTYAWVTEEPLIKPQAGTAGGAVISPLLDPIIRSAVERHFGAKGYAKVDDPAQADLVVSYTIGARDKIEVNSYPVGAGYRYGGGWGYGGGYATDVDTYTEGVLALDFFDAKTKRAVWHGFGSKRLSSSPSPERTRENVDQAVVAILKKFPARGEAPKSD